GPLVEDRRGSAARPWCASRGVHERAFVGLDHHGVAYGDLGSDADDRLAHGDAAVGPGHDVETGAFRVGLHPSDLVGVGRADDELDELAVWTLDHAQLIAAVGRREDAWA